MTSKPLPLGLQAYREPIAELTGALPLGPYEFDAWALTHEFPEVTLTEEDHELGLVHGTKWHSLLDLMIHHGYVYANVITCAHVVYEPRP